MNRRTFVSTVAGGMAGAVAACKSAPTAQNPRLGPRLVSRPRAPTTLAGPGLQKLGLSATPPDGQLFVPAGHSADKPLPLLLLLHGAGGSSANWFGSYDDRAEAAKYIVLAPDSRFATWDAIYLDYSIDVAFIDSALAAVFDRCAVDPARIAVAGFSDGATYALGLGLANGDLFKSVLAYSPGFLLGGERIGKPGVFVSHGTNDTVLPIDEASRFIVPRLRSLEYQVEYREFNGGHEVPQSISDVAFQWLGEQFK